MTNRDSRTVSLSVLLNEDLIVELGQLARESHTTEGALAQTAVKALIRARRGPTIPRYARRLGPLVMPEEADS